ncbi:hypothetical protein CEXT_28751 [Caerostris extrusa]|uniref:Uncharacterized protein n=1 Tax=Caerostris extrusa TaxID=172846 RepID=A0AAV4RSC5_CAEEX|nr:hypothetical protein CEXT_28751 [Caerostris extrusa]
MRIYSQVVSVELHGQQQLDGMVTEPKPVHVGEHCLVALGSRLRVASKRSIRKFEIQRTISAQLRASGSPAVA